MPGRSFSSPDYRYGFNGMEKDGTDWTGNDGSHLDFGARIYDARLGRWFATDPLQGTMATWSPYSYAIDNPIVFIDEEGEYPGITFYYYEFDVGAGLSYGLNYVKQGGIAYDEVGKTSFVTTSALHITNQQLENGSNNPQLIIGADVSFTLNVKQNWKFETFSEYAKGGDDDKAIPLPTRGKLGAFGGIGLTFNSEELGLGAGLGAGLKITTLSNVITFSVSLSDNEAEKISFGEPWRVSGVTKIFDDNKNVIGYEGEVVARSSQESGKLEVFKVYSDAIETIDSDGNKSTKSTDIWQSKDYSKKVIDVEGK